MRELKYCVECSLDGFIAREDHSYDFLLADGGHADEFNASLSEFDVAVMGRKTYEIGVESGAIDATHGLDLCVVSNTLPRTRDYRVKVISENPDSAIRAMKGDAGKNILLSGGAKLASALLHLGLVDVLSLRIHPVLIGSGIPVFRDLPRDVRLEAFAHKKYDNGVILVSYNIR